MKQDLQGTPLDQELIASGYRQSLALLRRNATPLGVLAASPGERSRERHYTTIFGRDAAICALGMAAAGEADLIECARAGLLTLARHQAANGQLPNYVDPETGEVDFWYTGCIDATLWWLLAVDGWDRLTGGDLRRELKPRIERALAWLSCQEHPAWGLLQQNEASDWADIMPRSGFVLYSNALWYGVKRRYELPGAATTREHAKHLFHPFDGGDSAPRRLGLLAGKVREAQSSSPYFLSFVNFAFWGAEGDLFGNLLAVLCGLADAPQAERVVDATLELGAHRPHPLRAVARPITPEDPLWRPYMLRHRQNHPWQYHNGGSWPFIGGFWVLALRQLGRDLLAWQELEAMARTNREGGWAFNEWFHGRSGLPMGMPGQSWNAAMYLLAHQALHHRPAWSL